VGTPRRRSPPRWADPELDEAALAVARSVRRALRGLEAVGDARWRTWFSGTLSALEDGDRGAVEQAARTARAAFGSTDSVLAVWPAPDAIVLREEIDRLLRCLHTRKA
jgi:hypothetical protein